MSVDVDGIELRVGNGEVHIAGQEGTVYAAPTMIVHYVQKHGYCPPTEFIDALVLQCEDSAPSLGD